MKYIINIIILSIMIVTMGCETSTDPKDKDDNEDVQSYSTANVKETTDYFRFSSNSGSTNANSDHDVVFYSEDWQPPGAPITIKDPRFKSKNGLSIAVINNTNLEDLDDVPDSANFIANFVSELGEWYYTTEANLILPYEKVYIVNTTDGEFPAFQIISYYDEEGESGVFNIKWKYLDD